MPNSVLVVEDDHALRTLIEHMLQEHGYGVRCATTVPEAVAALTATRSLCLVLWDPMTLPLSGSFITLAGQLGVHIATIPVGVTAKGQRSDGTPIVTKRLTSVEAVLSVLRAHCTHEKEHAIA